jgi:hypothetical protein
MITLNNISIFTGSKFDGNAILLNNAFKGYNGYAKSLKPYGVQSVEPLFYSPNFNPLLTNN